MALFSLPVAELDNVSEYVYRQMDPARDYLDSMRKALPKLMESNRSLIDAITHDRHSSRELEEKYLSYESTLPKLQERLAEYGNLYIKHYDFAVSVRSLEGVGFDAGCEWGLIC